MRIATVSAQNFKGRSFIHHLGAVTIFHGDNGVGKSAIIEALRLGMLGYDPRVPKKKPDIFRAFASGAAMKVEVEFEGGKVNKIDLVDKGNSITGQIGINYEVSNYLLDLSEYWKKSQADRAQALMAMCVSEANRATLFQLEKRISELELSISNDMARRKVVENAIASKASADATIQIIEPPKDLGLQITTAKQQLAEGDGHLRNFSAERAARAEAQRAMDSMQRAQAEAIRLAPEPVCEHCGNTVAHLKQLAATSFAEPMQEAYARLQSMRTMEEIGQSIQEWTDYSNKLRGEIQAMENQQRLWQQHIGTLNNDRKMQEELDLIGPRLEKSREDLKTHQTKRKDMLTKSVAPLLEKANMFLKPTLEMELVIENGEIGFVKGRFIPFVSLSGAQEVMAVAGLQLALAAESPTKLVIMDELGRLSPPTKQRLIDTLQELLQNGHIQQFIGCDVVKTGYGKVSPKIFVEVSNA